MTNFAWIKDKEDKRDFRFSAIKPKLEELPSQVDLRANFDLVYDQLYFGSCTSNCIALSIDFTRLKEGLDAVKPSRFFIYYNERVLEDTTPEDAGASLRDGMKTINTIGVCRETTWDYNPKNIFRKPWGKAYYWAEQRKVKEYHRLNNQNLDELKACLADGYTFVFGFYVYASFEQDYVAHTGIVRYPANDDILVGGHAVCAVGYDDERQVFICRNSWGKDWGDEGHFYMPYTYIKDTNLCDDFWTIRGF